MKAILSLEYIGAATWDRLRQFERFERMIIGGQPLPVDHPDYMAQPGPRVTRYALEGDTWIVSEVHGQRDYSGANSRGTRGVMVRFILDDSAIYRVKEPVSWRNCAHYFAAVDADGAVLKMEQQEALKWASVHLV